jgi:hypothetical protein
MVVAISRVLLEQAQILHSPVTHILGIGQCPATFATQCSLQGGAQSDRFEHTGESKW